MSFPIDVSPYKALELDPAQNSLTDDQQKQLETNIKIVRDTIVFFTAIAGIKGYAGHTGGAYDIVPEVLIAEGFMRGPASVYPVHFDEAGHRVAIQYAMSAFNGEMRFENLFHYREAGHGLFGHPEIEEELGVKFASGRLGHMWPFINGVARANPNKAVVMYGSDGSQQEGNDAEAARWAVAQNLNVKLFIDDNNVTIAGKPSEYQPGFDIARTLEGHGLTVDVGDGEDWPALYARMATALTTDGPVAVVNKRLMAPGVPGIEDATAGHDVIKKDDAIAYLKAQGQDDAVTYLEQVDKPKKSVTYRGSSEDVGSNRNEFGKIIADILGRMSDDERLEKVFVVDSDLEGSTGIKAIREAHPEIYVKGGVMERGNFSAAAGFGFEKGRQGIFATFSAFIEMVVSELTMARLNRANVICHFSHAGVDEIADNTCHFGVNIFFGNNGFGEDNINRLYFAADALQLKAMVEKIFDDPGIRFVFTTRSKVPFILDENGSKMYGGGYEFTPGKDEIVREGAAGYVISYGELMYRALDAVEQCREEGIDVGLINKPTLNIIDEGMMKKVGQSPFALVVEGQNRHTGLGSRYGSWLLERGLSPKYAWLAVDKNGIGGIEEQIPHQGLAPEHIKAKIEELAR